ncbi:acyltransferase [Paraburkholderia phymatum]|uniref:Acyltransferase-like protein n=1 Tax=Paraburkholderia phymatum (strain DSM 17167 / CIP 108236 / LMG 21445 / STM815) TaxID=391038 RepID=B2JCZ0_PARP8|nr:acyltransferase [Paraburkholderia phymatum]ACC71046.1 acyltransferase-like protein [Paraburkholderia phymatum STM815]
MTETANPSRLVPNKATSPTSAATKQVGRVEEIDGIRGWAALCVVVFHVCLETFSKLHPHFVNPSSFFFFDGPMAVYVFFILSGDALSTPFLSTEKKSLLDKMVVKRYFRLVAPIAIMTAITVVAIRIGLTHNKESALIVHREDWLGILMPSDFTMLDALKYPFLTVFSFGEEGKGFNPFLWTMPIELTGSAMVFLYLYVHSRIKRQTLTLAVIIAFTFLANKWYTLFFLGVLFSHLRVNGQLDHIRGKMSTRVIAPLLVIASYALEYRFLSVPDVTHVTSWLDSITIFAQDNKKFLMAVLFLIGAYLSKDMRRFFQNGVSRFLGKVSFPIYLAQALVICTFSSYVITRSAPYLDRTDVCVAIGATGVAITIAFGYCLSIVERHLMKGIDRVVALAMR